METKLKGRWGEEKAADLMCSKGYKIIGAGYRTRFGEIDLIAENRKYVVFVEVKMRKNANFAEAKEFVNAAKRQRIVLTANLWLSSNDTSKQPRFDVIEIYAPEGTLTQNPRINHIENAFYENF